MVTFNKCDLALEGFVWEWRVIVVVAEALDVDYMLNICIYTKKEI